MIDNAYFVTKKILAMQKEQEYVHNAPYKAMRNIMSGRPAHIAKKLITDTSSTCTAMQRKSNKFCQYIGVSRSPKYLRWSSL